MPGTCVSHRLNKFSVIVLACLLAGACASPETRLANATLEAARSSNEAATRALEAGNSVLALRLYRASLAGAQSIEDFDLAGANLLNLALVHSQLGQWPDAHAAVDKVLAAPRNFNDASTARAAARKSLIYADEGNSEAALRWADTAERGCAAPCALMATLENLRAHLALDRSQIETAIRHSERAAQFATAPALDAERANAWCLLGRAYTRAGRTAEAAAVLANALELDRQLGLSARISLDLLYAGDNEARRGNQTRAREFYERAATVSAATADAVGVQAARARLNGLPQ